MWLITGATGRVGSMALKLAQARHGGAVAGLVRDAARARAKLGDQAAFRVADYNDRQSLDAAMAGVTHLLFVSSDGAADDVVRHHANVIEAACSARVGHIVFTSIVDIEESSRFYFAPVYQDAERRLRAANCRWTILRCNLYWDFIYSNWLAPARTSGVIDVPAGSGTIAPVSCADVAAAAVAAFDPGHDNRVYELTKSRALSFADMARLAGEAFDKPIVYRPADATAYLRRCLATMEAPWPQAFASLFESIRDGRFCAAAPGMAALLQRRPEDPEVSIRRFMQAEGASGSPPESASGSGY